MNEERFFYQLGTIAYLSWPLYFLIYKAEYSTEEIIEAITFISILMVIYFAITIIYFRIVMKKKKTKVRESSF
ncbi:hypothetical protein MUN89_05995 [Halobacillus salinarum]|uniref:Uncharacterized protein n=1 Tax=Halobacillus salinarum TaxID=2932257 RepID=A0ABY4EM81_9BACI|nr:hypothetical protein [Halobacillus salinarum]UOQ45495.1 hypothetical protein MUN89_05995 [Halobacillus salinarum]